MALATAAFAFAFLMNATSPAKASDVCMPTAELEAALIDWYGESPVATDDENLVVWVSDQGQTWTLVEYAPDGFACSIASGENWPTDDPVLMSATSDEEGYVARADHSLDIVAD